MQQEVRCGRSSTEPRRAGNFLITTDYKSIHRQISQRSAKHLLHFHDYSSMPSLKVPKMTNFKITVTSDTICPWCYVGRKQLIAAEKLYHELHPSSGDTFSVSYMPYMLRPDWQRGPAGAKDKQEAYLEKFGPERVKQMQHRLSLVGDELGIDFKFGGRTGNTRDSHRLVRLAKKYGPEVEGKAMDGLFQSYFEKEGDITDYENLRGIASAAGIPDADFQKAIVDSDEGGKEVDRDVVQAQLRGINSVPNYILQDKYQLGGGARDPESFVEVLEKIKEMESNGA
jgi:predicted DsbA family dithiol-disulfide isomerase